MLTTIQNKEVNYYNRKKKTIYLEKLFGTVEVKPFYQRTEIPRTKGRTSKIFTEIKNEINYKELRIDITIVNNKSLRHSITKLM